MSQERRERTPNEEHEQPPFYRASRFASEPLSKGAYFQTQSLILETDAELSVFRFQLNQVYHVALVGEVSPQPLIEQIEGILATGETTSLPPNVIKTLAQRRSQANDVGTWVEGHYRPGKHIQS